MFPILNPSPSSLPIPSLWVVPVHQPQASSIVHRTWTGNSFHTWYYTWCFNAILPNLSTLSLSHRVHKTVLYFISIFKWVYRTQVEKYIRGSDGKICLQCGRSWLDPTIRKIHWRRKWQLTPVFLPGEFHGERSLTVYSSSGYKELYMSEWLSLHFTSWVRAEGRSTYQ